MIKNQILNYRASYPASFIQSMIEIIQTGQDQNSRGEFSRQCFEIGSGLTSDSDVKEIVVILTRRVDKITFKIRYNKVGCVFPIVICSDHREDAHHFRIYAKKSTIKRLNQMNFKI